MGFDELFTIDLIEGEPVQRPLAEMTADEVLGAVGWLEVERYWKGQASDAVHDLLDENLDLEKEGRESEKTEGLFLAAASAGGAQWNALERFNQLIDLICALAPDEEVDGMTIDEVLRRFWPPTTEVMEAAERKAQANAAASERFAWSS